MRKENRSINVLKGIACLLVVLNHYHGSGIVGDFILTISNFGVPVFFLISGYFLYNEEGETIKRLPTKIVHILQLILLHIGLYIIDFISENILLDGNIIRKDIIVNNILSYFSIKSFKSSLFWSTSLFGRGQWFLFALLEGYIVFFILYKLQMNKVLETYGIWISIVLFFIHIPIRLFMIRFGVDYLFGVNTSESMIVRNVWFDAVPFMLVGICLHKYQDGLQFLTNYVHIIRIISFIVLMISILEYYLTVAIVDGRTINSVLYIGTIVSVISAFICAILQPNINRGRLSEN